MRFTFLFLFLMILLVSSDFKPAKKLFVPPGTVPVNDTLYFDRTEITNIDWREYAWWSKRTYGDAEYKRCLPDTLVWRNELSYNEPYVAYYLWHPAYSNYPVVGISYKQAVDYCKWRTERVKQTIELNVCTDYSKMILPKIVIPRVVEFPKGRDVLLVNTELFSAQLF